MFTGIVQGIGKVTDIKIRPGLKQMSIELGVNGIKGLLPGASVAIDGVCLTVVDIDQALFTAQFDAIEETLNKTTLKNILIDDKVNFERAARFGDEIGGHILSGHVYDTATIIDLKKSAGTYVITFKGRPAWLKYLFPKGYIAIDGISLTLVDVNDDETFTVHLIPETLRATTLGEKEVGDEVNIEVDSQIQAIVDTIERIDGRSPLYRRPA